LYYHPDARNAKLEFGDGGGHRFIRGDAAAAGLNK
jgi:hypothetical protein